MSETKIEVPKEMFEAAVNSVGEDGRGVRVDSVRRILEAALLWQKTNGPRPTAQQCFELRNLALAVNRNYSATEPTSASCAAVAVDWVSRMYDAPEPEVPEAIKQEDGR